MRKKIIGILVQSVSAFIFAIAGSFLLFYLNLLLRSGGIDLSLYLAAGDKTGVFIGMFIGAPIGAAFGVFIAKRFFLKTSKHSILRLALAFIFAFLGGFLWLFFMHLINASGLFEDLALFPFIAIFSLIGYNAIEIFSKVRYKNRQ